MIFPRTSKIWAKKSPDSISDQASTVQIDAGNPADSRDVIAKLIADQNTRSVRLAADVALNALLSMRALELGSTLP